MNRYHHESRHAHVRMALRPRSQATLTNMAGSAQADVPALARAVSDLVAAVRSLAP